MEGARGMPGRRGPKKDAGDCEKPWGAVDGPRSTGLRMGQPAPGDAGASVAESIGGGGEPGELKHLSTPRKRKQHARPPVVVSERGCCPNHRRAKAAAVAAVGLWAVARAAAAARSGQRRSRTPWDGRPQGVTAP